MYLCKQYKYYTEYITTNSSKSGNLVSKSIKDKIILISDWVILVNPGIWQFDLICTP